MASDGVAMATEECVANRQSAVSVRIIKDLQQVAAVRPAWTSWRGHRDADIDFYQAVLASRSDAARPHVVLIERDGIPDAALVGEASTTTLRERIAYVSVPVSRVRVLSFVYGGFLGNQSRDNSELIVKELVRSLCDGEADLAVVSYVRRETSFYDVALTLPSFLMRDHFPVKQYHSMMDLPKTVEAIYRGFSGKHRAELRRDGKRFRAAFSDDIQIRRFAAIDQLDQLIAVAEQVAATTYQRGLGVGFSNTRQVRELLTLEAAKGWLRGFVLYAGGQPCAFLIGSIYNDIFLSEYFAHDPAYSKHSPGMYLLAHAMEDLCREGVAKIDFGIGEAFYKQRFGNCHWQESILYLYAPTWTGMRVKALRTMAVLINSTGKSLLQRMKLVERVKKLWRRRVTDRNAV